MSLATFVHGQQTDINDLTEVRWGQPASGCQLALLPLKSTVVPGERVSMLVLVRNSSASDVVFTETSRDTDFAVTVTTYSGGKVPFTEFGERLSSDPNAVIRGSSGPKTLTKGEIYRGVIEVDRFYRLGPGTYKVRISCNSIITPPGSPSSALPVTSNEATFEVH